MTSGELYWYFSKNKNYLCWGFGVYTNRDRRRPVLKPLFIKNHDGRQQIKLEYYQDISCTQSQFIASEYLDAEIGNEEFFSLINARMRSDKWFEMPECFTGKHHSLPLLVGSIYITNWMGKEVQSFLVRSAGSGANHRDPVGRCVSTETVFDLCVPTERLDVDRWYKLYFESDSENETRWHGFPHRYTNQMSLILTGTLGNWSFGISAYNSKSDPQLRNFYEVRYAPDGNGFLFRINQEGIDRIWFKAAWLKSAGLDKNLCQQALRHWLA